jgi:hypothetical protein
MKKLFGFTLALLLTASTLSLRAETPTNWKRTAKKCWKYGKAAALLGTGTFALIGTSSCRGLLGEKFEDFWQGNNKQTAIIASVAIFITLGIITAVEQIVEEAQS